MARKLANFFKTFLKSLEPTKYEDLSQNAKSTSYKYFFCLILFAFVVFWVLTIPKTIDFAEDFNNQFSNFQKLRFDVNASMSSAVNLPANNPAVIIDTNLDEFAMKKEKLIITDKNLYYKLTPYSDVRTINLEKFYNADLESLSKVFVVLFVFVLPSLLIYSFIYIIVKYFVVMIIASVIFLFFVRGLRFEIEWHEINNIAIYALTPLFIVSFILYYIGTGFYYVQYIIYGIYIVFGTIKTGQKEPDRAKHMRERKKKLNGKYIEF